MYSSRKLNEDIIKGSKRDGTRMKKTAVYPALKFNDDNVSLGLPSGRVSPVWSSGHPGSFLGDFFIPVFLIKSYTPAPHALYAAIIGRTDSHV